MKKSPLRIAVIHACRNTWVIVDSMQRIGLGLSADYTWSASSRMDVQYSMQRRVVTVPPFTTVHPWLGIGWDAAAPHDLLPIIDHPITP